MKIHSLSDHSLPESIMAFVGGPNATRGEFLPVSPQESAIQLPYSFDDRHEVYLNSNISFMNQTHINMSYPSSHYAGMNPEMLFQGSNGQFASTLGVFLMGLLFGIMIVAIFILFFMMLRLKRKLNSQKKKQEAQKKRKGSAGSENGSIVSEKPQRKKVITDQLKHENNQFLLKNKRKETISDPFITQESFYEGNSLFSTAKTQMEVFRGNPTTKKMAIVASEGHSVFSCELNNKNQLICEAASAEDSKSLSSLFSAVQGRLGTNPQTQKDPMLWSSHEGKPNEMEESKQREINQDLNQNSEEPIESALNLHEDHLHLQERSSFSANRNQVSACQSPMANLSTNPESNLLMKKSVKNQTPEPQFSARSDSYKLENSYLRNFNKEASVISNISQFGDGDDADDLVLDNGKFARYFTEHQMIGDGGFGKVWKVRHRFDKKTYAVKEISLTISNKDKLEVDKETLNEIQLLSCFNHSNIVRYFGCWIEMEEHIPNQEGSFISETIREDSAEESNQAISSVFISSQIDKSGNGFEWEDDETKEKKQIKKEFQELERPIEPKKLEEGPIKLKAFIQMEFCRLGTLSNLLEKAVKIAESDVIKIFKQILSGVKEIHGKHMVHADLK